LQFGGPEVFREAPNALVCKFDTPATSFGCDNPNSSGYGLFGDWLAFTSIFGHIFTVHLQKLLFLSWEKRHIVEDFVGSLLEITWLNNVTEWTKNMEKMAANNRQ